MSAEDVAGTSQSVTTHFPQQLGLTGKSDHHQCQNQRYTFNHSRLFFGYYCVNKVSNYFAKNGPKAVVFYKIPYYDDVLREI